MKDLLLLILLTASLSLFGQVKASENINSILAEQVDSQLSPGLTVGVVEKGELVYHSSQGLMNLEYDLPFNDSTVFGVASITKQFTSACVAVLEARGKLSVNDDIRKYIPELAFSGDTIRIKHLLNHTSGIRNHNVLLDLSGFDYAHRGYTNASIQQIAFRQKGINNRPGDKILYSNTNYVLLALLIERVSGSEIHDFAKAELFDPLGMTSTFFKSDPSSVDRNRAYSYYKEGETYKQPKSLTLCVGAGGVASTVSDLAIWSQVFLDPNHSFSFIADFVTLLEPLTDGTPVQHARGMFVVPYKGYQTINHGGRDWGMRSQFICLPELDLAVIVFANSEAINAEAVSYQILDLWIQQEAPKAETQKKYRPKSREVAAHSGYYQELNSDLRMHVFVENDTLKAQSSFGRFPVPLVANSKDCFSRIDNASVRYTFLPKGTSEADLWVDFGGGIFYFEKIELTETPNQNLSEYSGQYFSEELDVTYELIVSGENLILNFPNNEGLVLKESQKDVFGANRRTKYSFNRDGSGKVVTFFVAAEGTVKNILFKRID